MPDAKPDNTVLLHARRVIWACGLCFGLLFLMGLSGLASITLLYDDPLMRTNQSTFEGGVVGFLSSFDGVIHFLHEWGGYVGIVLTGWAGLEVFNFGRVLRRGDSPKWRVTGGRLMPLGIAGAALVIVSLVMLISSGVAARDYLQNEPPAAMEEMPGGERMQRIPGAMEYEKEDEAGMVDWHVRQLNYLLAIGAILLVFASSSTRKIQLEIKKAAKP